VVFPLKIAILIVHSLDFQKQGQKGYEISYLCQKKEFIFVRMFNTMRELV